MKPFRAPYTALLARCSDQLSQWFFVQPESRTGDPQLFFFANDYNVERQLDSLAIAITTQKFAGFMCHTRANFFFEGTPTYLSKV